MRAGVDVSGVFGPTAACLCACVRLVLGLLLQQACVSVGSQMLGRGGPAAAAAAQRAASRASGRGTTGAQWSDGATQRRLSVYSSSRRSEGRSSLAEHGSGRRERRENTATMNCDARKVRSSRRPAKARRRGRGDDSDGRLPRRRKATRGCSWQERQAMAAAAAAAARDAAKAGTARGAGSKSRENINGGGRVVRVRKR